MKHFLFIACYLFLSSCVTPIKLHKKSSADPSSGGGGRKWEKTISSFLFGFVTSSKNIKAWEKCPGDWHTIKITKPFAHVTISLLTVGLYTPLKVIIVCEPYTPPTNKTDEFDKFNEISL